MIRKSAILGGVALAALAVFWLLLHSGPGQSKTTPGVEASATPHLTGTQTTVEAGSNAPRPVAPFIRTDTTTDSPGTNLATRVVTLTAEVGGTPPIFRQWKVDKGSGFMPVTAQATNSVLIISNAQVADTGRYALFATNGVAGTNTTPVSLVVVEGAD